MTPLEAFRAVSVLPSAELYVALILEPLDMNGNPISVYVSNAPSLSTEPNDEPANVGFRSIVLSNWQTSRRIADTGTFLRSSGANSGQILLADPAGDVDEWLGYTWSSRPFTALAGARHLANGDPYPFSLFLPFFVGLTSNLTRTSSGDLELSFEGLAKRLDRSISTDTFRGFGGAVSSGPADAMTGPDGPSFALSSGLTLEYFGVIDSLPGVFANLVARGGDYGIGVDSAGELYVVHDSTSDPTGAFVIAGEEIYLGLAIDPDAGNQATLYFGRDSRDVKPVYQGLISPFAFAGGDLSFGPGLGFTCWECRLWNVARSESEILGGLEGPISDPVSRTSLVEGWKFGDGTGLVALGEKGAIDLALSGSQEFVSSFDGDDPEQFSGGAFGNYKPLLLGSAYNLPLAFVDSQFNTYQATVGALLELSRVKARGAFLIPYESFTSDALGEISTDPVDDAIVFSPGSGFTGHRFIEGIADSSVPGQRIEILGSSTLADGVYRIRAAGIQNGGARILVEADSIDSSPAGLPSLSLPAGTTVETPAADRHYSYDLQSGTISAGGIPLDYELTADAVGTLDGLSGSSVSAVVDYLASLVGVGVDNSALSFDPPIGLLIPASSSEPMTIREVLDEVVSSAIGWWVEDRSGQIRIGNHAVPDTNAVATIVGGDISSLAETEKIAPIVARMAKFPAGIQQLPAIDPRSSLRIGYARNWSTLAADGIVGSVPAARRSRLIAEYQYVTRHIRRAAEAYPDSTTQPAIDTLLTNRSDAETALDFAEDIFSTKLVWWRVRVEGLAMLSVDVWDVIVLFHDNPIFGLQNGVYCRVMSIEEDFIRDGVMIECFGVSETAQ